LLAQLIEFRGIIPGFGDRQQQPADMADSSTERMLA